MRMVSRQENYLLNIAYYKLQAEENLAYYVIGQGIKNYRIGDTHEILNQALLLPRVCCIWKTMGKKLKILARTGLGGSQRHGSAMTNAMEGNLPDTIWDVMQMNHQNGAPGIDKSYRMIRS